MVADATHLPTPTPISKASRAARSTWKSHLHGGPACGGIGGVGKGFGPLAHPQVEVGHRAVATTTARPTLLEGRLRYPRPQHL